MESRCNSLALGIVAVSFPVGEDTSVKPDPSLFGRGNALLFFILYF